MPLGTARSNSCSSNIPTLLGAATPAAGTRRARRAPLPENCRKAPSASVLYCGKWPKTAAGPDEGTFSKPFISVCPTGSFAPRTAATCRAPGKGAAASLAQASRLVFYFKLQPQRERCETEMGTEQVPQQRERSPPLWFAAL